MSVFYEDIFYTETEASYGDESALGVRRAKFDNDDANDHLLFVTIQVADGERSATTIHLPLEDVKALKEELEKWIKEREKAND